LAGVIEPDFFVKLNGIQHTIFFYKHPEYNPYAVFPIQTGKKHFKPALGLAKQ